MNRDIAEILKETVNPDLFRESLLKLEGDFDFGVDSMIRLGEVYCSLYPDSVSHGDSAQVQIGYRLVRIAVVEVLVTGMDKDLKFRYREMFTNISTIGKHIETITGLLGHDMACSIHRNLDVKVREIKAEIDTMQNSVIKERFTGGISVFYNILYLMKKSLDAA